MKNSLCFLLAAIVTFYCVGIATAEPDLLTEGRIKGDAAALMNRFPLGMNTSGQFTTTGCGTNPQNGDIGPRTPLQQLALANEATTFVAYNDAMASRGPGGPGRPGGPGGPGGPNPPWNPNNPWKPWNPQPPIDPGDPDPPPPATTPEPGTLILVGMGVLAMTPLARRYRRKK